MKKWAGCVLVIVLTPIYVCALVVALIGFGVMSAVAWVEEAFEGAMQP